MTKPRLRYRCVSIESEAGSARVQTAEGENLSPETVEKLVELFGAVKKTMKRGEPIVAFIPDVKTKRLKKGPPK